MQMLETLENRWLFDGTTLVSRAVTLDPIWQLGTYTPNLTTISAIAPFHVTSKGTLVIDGKPTADVMHVRVVGGKASAVVGGTTFHLATAVVKRVYCDLGGGDDRVQIDVDAKTPVTVLGGNGNDRLSVAGGPATLVGGNGHDVLIGQGDFSMDFVGGRGNDRMYGTDAADTFTGGDGWDYAETIWSGKDGAGDALEVQRVLTT